MKITEGVKATHENLSAEAGRFLDYVLKNEEHARRLDYTAADLPEWVRQYPYPLQSWPTFVGGPKLKEIRHATVGMTELVKSVPERILGSKRRIAEFYRMSEPLVTLLFVPPNGISGALARCDFLDSSAGLKCLEVNMGAYLGGWQVRFWEQMYRGSPAVSRFLEEQGCKPVSHDPLKTLFQHIVEDSLSHSIGEDGVLNVALVVEEQFLLRFGGAVQQLNEVYSAVLEEGGRGLTGIVVICSYPDGLELKRGVLHHWDLPIHIVVEYTNLMTPQDVYRCFKGEMISLYNGPLSRVMGDKRNLALLSQFEDSDIFSDAEKAQIREHVPWTREVANSRVSYRGESAALPDLLLARREDFVVKRSNGSRGEDVYIGRSTSPEAWKRHVRDAAATPGWVAQEFIESRPYLYQHGECGYVFQRVVWGLFCFGRSYGGGFLRMMPMEAGDGIINSARGATEGFIFEV